jgi:hypothetical protein
VRETPGRSAADGAGRSSLLCGRSARHSWPSRTSGP